MKRFIYKIIPFVFIFVLFFSVSAVAQSKPDSTQVYCSKVLSETDTVVYFCEYYLTAYGNVQGKLINYSASGYDGNRDCFYLQSANTDSGYSLKFIGNIGGVEIHVLNSDGTIRSTTGNNGIANVCPSIYATKANTVTSHTTDSFCTNMPIFATKEEAEAYRDKLIGVESAINYMKIYDADSESWVPVVVEDPEDGKNDGFVFDIFGEFQDFTQQSSEYNNAAQKQAVTENSNNPNDGVFQNIFQAISGLIHTGNSITQQISNQIQNFVDQFFNNFAQSALGLLSEIKDSLGNILPENLTNMIDQLYESGLDSSGNFGIDTMFNYWFVPDTDLIMNNLKSIVNSDSQLSPVFSFANSFENQLINIEPVAPEIIIPAGAYGFLTFKEDIVLNFEWFSSWKVFSDPLIAAFLYLTYFWHLFCSIPSILHGGSATVASSNHFYDKQVRESRRG